MTLSVRRPRQPSAEELARVAAENRVAGAEECVARAISELALARQFLAPVKTGLNQQAAKIENIEPALREIRRDLVRCRKSGFCGLGAPRLGRKP